MYPLLILVILLMGNQTMGQESAASRSVIALEISAPDSTAGGMIAADVNDDGAYDLLVTAPGYVGAYTTDGRKLWSRRVDVRVGGRAEARGLPGHHGPGLQAGDIDADGRTEVVFFDQQSTLHVVHGGSGQDKWALELKPPPGALGWEHVVIADFRGTGDRDLLVQATNARGNRLGRYLAAYAVEDLQAGKKTPLWQRNDFIACAHNGARVADLDGDGRDEVLGGTILAPDGEILSTLDVVGHIDSVYVADVRPDIPGLEVVLLEEGRLNRVFLVGKAGLIWQTNYKSQEPQNAVVGRFLQSRTDMQIWCRSRYNEHQAPFVFDAFGKLYSEYRMNDVVPEGWTIRGVEVIHSIQWTGADRWFACAKERHEPGDIAVFDPITGRFILHISEKADRLYVADVLGDWREEIIVWSGNELHIYTNRQPNPHPHEPRLWTLPHYRRSKMTWNYYSP